MKIQNNDDYVVNPSPISMMQGGTGTLTIYKL